MVQTRMWLCMLFLQAVRLREVDAKIQREEFVDLETLSQYFQDIRTAEKEKIQAADIVLCTCATSAASRIRYNTNVMQVSSLTHCIVYHRLPVDVDCLRNGALRKFSLN